MSRKDKEASKSAGSSRSKPESLKSMANNGEAPSIEADALNVTKFTDALQALKADIGGKNDSKVDSLFSNLRSEITAVKEELKNSLSGLQTTVDKHSATIHDLECFATTHSNTVAGMESKLSKLSAKVCALKTKCDDLEGRQRRHNLCILGIPEADEGPRPTELIAQLLQGVLELEKKPLLDMAHRSLRPKPKKGKPPQAFFIRVHYYHVRDQILRRAAEASPLLRGGNRLSIFPDFTAEAAKRHVAFVSVKKILHEHPSIKFRLFFPA